MPENIIFMDDEAVDADRSAHLRVKREAAA